MLPKAGAHDQSRTDDLILTKDVLYQLSYMGKPPDAKNDKKPTNPSFVRKSNWD